MAEGTSDGAPLQEPTVAEEEEKAVETPAGGEQPVVRPKRWEKRTTEGLEDQDTHGAGVTQATSGHWWHSSALMGKTGTRVPTRPPQELSLSSRVGGNGSGLKMRRGSGTTPLGLEQPPWTY